MIDTVQDCEHDGQFELAADVTRLTDHICGCGDNCKIPSQCPNSDAVITGYMVDIQLTCGKCGLPFHWLGPAGMSFAAPMVSADGEKLLAPCAPGDSRVSMLDQIEDHTGKKDV